MSITDITDDAGINPLQVIFDEGHLDYDDCNVLACTCNGLYYHMNEWRRSRPLIADWLARAPRWWQRMPDGDIGDYMLSWENNHVELLMVHTHLLIGKNTLSLRITDTAVDILDCKYGTTAPLPQPAQILYDLVSSAYEISPATAAMLGGRFRVPSCDGCGGGETLRGHLGTHTDLLAAAHAVADMPLMGLRKISTRDYEPELVAKVDGDFFECYQQHYDPVHIDDCTRAEYRIMLRFAGILSGHSLREISRMVGGTEFESSEDDSDSEDAEDAEDASDAN